MDEGSPIYESDDIVAQYLLLHYGSAESVLSHGVGPADALDYPRRCVSELLRTAGLGPSSRALDVGCAVGRSSFELARHCGEVIGLDLSRQFIEIARRLKQEGRIAWAVPVEGGRTASPGFSVPEECPRERVTFAVGDASRLDHDLGSFDVVLAANLVDRLADPRAFLDRLTSLVRPGGQLILTSPFTWLADFTPRSEWLSERHDEGTAGALREALSDCFIFLEERNLPFLIREHARKFQWSIAWAGVWRRKDRSS